ncbi:MAG: hypothetical protein ACOH2A_06580 [Sphingobacteriaceae bacterium]
MKLKFLIILVSAGLAFSGCNSNKQNTNNGDANMMQDSMGMDTMGMDSMGMGDTTRSGMGAGSATDSTNAPVPAP